MNKIAVLSLLLCLPLTTGLCQTGQPGLLDWLQGVWLDDNTGIYEHWVKTGEDKLKGQGYRVEKGTKEIYEEIILNYTAEGGIYIVSIPENGEAKRTVSFKSTVFTREVAVFENRGNKFPAKIKYERTGTDALKVLLYDDSDLLKVTYNFKRIQR